MSLSQTTLASAEADWKFWIVTIVAIVSLIQSLLFPVIGWMVRQIFVRLGRGDEKFEQHAEDLTTLKTVVGGISSMVKEVRDDLKNAGEKQVNFKIDGLGAVNEMRVAMHKEFVSREEFNRHTERAEERHQETIEAIHELGRQRR
jgi:hypothetical protein